MLDKDLKISARFILSMLWFATAPIVIAESPAWVKKPYDDQFPREQFFVGVGCVEIGESGPC